MISHNRFRKILVQIVEPSLLPLGYEFVGSLPDKPDSAENIPSMSFFRKRLWEDVFGFVSFQKLNMHAALPGEKFAQSFNVDLWRNKGPQPHHGYGSNEYRNWLLVPLGQLLWAVLDIKVYSWQYHTWGFSTPDDLSRQLRDAVEKLLEYGIPWLENPESKNPYPSR